MELDDRQQGADYTVRQQLSKGILYAFDYPFHLYRHSCIGINSLDHEIEQTSSEFVILRDRILHQQQCGLNVHEMILACEEEHIIQNRKIAAVGGLARPATLQEPSYNRPAWAHTRLQHTVGRVKTAAHETHTVHEHNTMFGHLKVLLCKLLLARSLLAEGYLGHEKNELLLHRR